MPQMTGGQALAKSLYREGVRVIFGLPGVQLYHLLDGLYDEPGINFITTRHEQATSYMADGYARAGGGIGTALVVPGPGLLNASAGLTTAYSASSPVLMLCGQIPREQIGKDIGLLHEVNDQLDCITPVTKWRRRVLQVPDIPAAVREAFVQLRSGRPRPVELEMPPETMEEEGEAELLTPVEIARATASAADINRAAEILLAAKRPLIYAGGGVNLSGAHEALHAVAEYLQAGVACTAEGKGAVSDHSDLSLGAAFWRESPLRTAIHAADVVLAVGSRLALVSFAPETRIVQIDADPEEIGRTHKGTLGLVGDARATLEALLEKLRAGAPARPSRKAEREALRAEIAAAMTQEPQVSIVKSLRAGCPEDTILIAGMTQIGYYSRPLWPTYGPRTYLSSSYSGNLGYEYPVALGAKVARPGSPVVAVIGDGGFLYNAQELATAAQSKLSEAFGVHGMRAKAPTEVGRLVAEAIALDRPVLLEVPVGRMPRPVFFPPRKAPTKYKR